MSSEEEADGRRGNVRGSEDQTPIYVIPSHVEQEDDARQPRQQILQRFRNRRSRLAGDRAAARMNFRAEGQSIGNNLLGLQDIERQIEVATENLNAVSNRPVPNISQMIQERAESRGEVPSSRRAKRRKLEVDNQTPEFMGFRYGKYGQVEPGKLKMEIVSCDGGIFQEGNYPAENILKNDDTVYCTKSNRCNLVLRHQGGTVFSLKELVIKAPHSGYTAPVQEGMIFVSMTSDDLLTRTAQYQIQYSPARSRSSASERRADLPSIMAVRHNHEGSAQARVGRLYDIGVQDEECDYRTAQIPPDFASNAQPFQVTTECSDSEDDENNRRSNVPRYRRETNEAYELSDSSESDFMSHDYLIGGHRSLHRSNAQRRRETASNITLAEVAEASQIATQEAVQAVGGELMVPHARFFIERDKSKCTIRFEPPVSGRFILLKMWSPHHSPSGNIDVQSVVANGFAGPRFFPDVTYR